MSAFFFYLFALIALASGIAMVSAKNPVASALCLIVSFIGLAALFITLDAFFIGIIQILVSAGAVMVLFLFIIMLINVPEETQRQFSRPVVFAGILVAIAFSFLAFSVIAELTFGGDKAPEMDFAAAAAERANHLGEDLAASDSILKHFSEGSLPDVQLIGDSIFLHYQFPLQVVAIILLVATIGVVVLSKKRLA